MSYIVPRDIPKGCEQCPFNDHTKCRTMPIGFDEYPLVGRRPDWCPLVEVKKPHGRLIDATFEENHYASMLLNPTPDVTEQDKHKARIIIGALRMAGTVIEAEGREE